MDAEYAEDDTHICLKCQTTITGLENYVSHRKSGCFSESRFRPVRPPDDDIHSTRPETISPIENNDLCLKADAFFSLLELQSSSKKQELGSRNPAGVVTRSKVSATQTKLATIRPEPVLGALVALAEGDDDEIDELKDAGCPPNKDGPSKWKPSVIGESPTPWTTPLLDEEREFSWEFSAQDQTSENLRWDSQIQGPRVGRLQSPSPTTQTKKTLCRSPMISDAPWKPQYQVPEPPPVTVGGKWKPEYVTEKAEEMRSEETRSEERKNEEMKSDDEGERHPMRRSMIVPPPGHTRGKWAPGMEARARDALGLAGPENNGVMPSPARKSGSTVQYWCAPCNRRLSSRSLYERHLLSELHFKRTLPLQAPMDPLNRESQQRARQPKPTQKALELQSTIKKVAPIKESKSRSHEQCQVCSARVLRHQIGKHLVSHYHWKGIQRGIARASSKTAADTLRTTADKMVLDNIHAIVKQAPFQCGLCRFYCNSSNAFREHWTSKMHTNKESEIEGDFWCWPCDIVVVSSTKLLAHLTSPEHLEVEAALNRTLPVIVRRRRDLLCVHPGCGRSFRLNIQLRHHQKAQGHVCQLRCGSCGIAKKNHLVLQRHVIRAHPVDVSKDGGPVFCARTQRLFPCAAAAVEVEQQETLVRTAPKPRRCPHCDVVLPSVAALRIHLEKRHPDLRVRCARCNAAFALPQQVTRHVRDGQCGEHLSRRQTPHTPGTATPQAPVQVDTNQPKSLACATCPYRSDSKAELLYHQFLHRESAAPFRCPVDDCEKAFQRTTSLRGHLRTHTGERPFRCPSCTAAFTRRYSLAAHRRQAHQVHDGNWTDWRSATIIQDPETPVDAASDAQLCAVCGKCLRDRTTLRHHMAVHNQRRFECDETGCSYRATSAAKLKRHQRAHSSERPFACAHCDFATKSQSQLQRHTMVHTGSRPHACPHCPFSSRLPLHLRRHMRVHTGAKPYKCPHCSYRCNVMENLRKHVLTTKRHADKKLYDCHECSEFSTNSAKEMQTHLMILHASKFATAAEASAYIMSKIYQAESETQTKQSNAPESCLSPVQHSDEDSPRTDDPEPTVRENQVPHYEDITHTIDHEETVNNIVTVAQANGRQVVVTCPDGQLISMIVLPSDSA